jgi:hypothetical protein
MNGARLGTNVLELRAIISTRQLAWAMLTLCPPGQLPLQKQEKSGGPKGS